jgi:hypothetical protein
MRTNLEPIERDPEGVHLVAKCIGWFDNGAISHFHVMLCIEDHLGFELVWWIYSGDLNVLSVNVFSNDPIELLVVRQEMTRGIQGVHKWGESRLEIVGRLW